MESGELRKTLKRCVNTLPQKLRFLYLEREMEGNLRGIYVNNWGSPTTISICWCIVCAGNFVTVSKSMALKHFLESSNFHLGRRLSWNWCSTVKKPGDFFPRVWTVIFNSGKRQAWESIWWCVGNVHSSGTISWNSRNWPKGRVQHFLKLKRKNS